MFDRFIIDRYNGKFRLSELSNASARRCVWGPIGGYSVVGRYETRAEAEKELERRSLDRAAARG